jgi:hypothetical protein
MFPTTNRDSQSQLPPSVSSLSNPAFRIVRNGGTKVLESVKMTRPMSVQFIRELHSFQGKHPAKPPTKYEQHMHEEF